MDPMKRVREFLLDNVGHMTHPGTASFDTTTGRWFVPIRCQSERGEVVVGDIEVDHDGHIIFAPSREEMLIRLHAAIASPPQPVNEEEKPGRITYDHS